MNRDFTIKVVWAVGDEELVENGLIKICGVLSENGRTRQGSSDVLDGEGRTRKKALECWFNNSQEETRIALQVYISSIILDFRNNVCFITMSISDQIVQQIVPVKSMLNCSYGG